ncbi:hypothetical protein BH24BAC1_BH24BAC1_25310 [soil metagenome]
MEQEQKNNPQQNQENQQNQNQNQEAQKQGQQESQYAGTTQGGQGAPASDGVESSDGRNTTIDGSEEHSIAGREDS